MSHAIQSAALRYPAADRCAQEDDYHGVKIHDPYRWLEDLDSAQTQAWIAAQNALTEDVLGAVAARPLIAGRLRRLWDYERYSVPEKHGDRYFYFKNSGLQNQAVLYTASSLSDRPVALLDPNTLAADGTIALGSVAVTDDGARIAYSTQASGSDWQEWRIRTVADGVDYPEVLQWSKFSGAAWHKDGAGFYYARYDEPASEAQFKAANYYQKLYFHRVGSPQSADRLVYERKDEKEWSFGPHVSDDGRYLILTVSRGTEPRNLVFYRDLAQPDGRFIELIAQFDAQYGFIDNDGPLFWFQTDKDAPRGRVVAIDIRKPADVREIIPQGADALQAVGVVGGTFTALYLKDARSSARVYDVRGTFVREIEFPGLGTVSGFNGKRHERETFYSFTSFTTPATIYRYDTARAQSEPIFAPRIDFRPEEYVTEQVFYASKDGTHVPMFISYKRGLERDGTAPAILYAYGGFNIPLTPAFSVSNLTWMEMGGVYAVANLRGGSEYGEDWHRAGMLENKQNVFDDFIAAAEWLKAHSYTSTAKLAINGGSNGGLLVGAVMTQRPDLAAAAVPEVGVMDMLRFAKFTIGWAWTPEFGCSDDPQQFATLAAYSPLHNLRPGTHYPATLVMTADHDDRVFPAHSFKFAAALQAAQAGSAPVVIRIEAKAGHGAGKPTSKMIDHVADKFAFLAKVLEL